MRIGLYAGLVALLGGASAGGPARAATARISVNVEETDVQAVFAAIAQDAAVTVTVAEGVQGTVSLKADDARVEDVLNAVAASVRARCVRTEDGYRIEPVPAVERPARAEPTTEALPARSAGSSAAPTGGGPAAAAGDDGIVTEVIQLKYADAGMIAQAFGGLSLSSTGMVSTGGMGWQNQGGDGGGWGGGDQWGGNYGWSGGNDWGAGSNWGDGGNRSRSSNPWGNQSGRSGGGRSSYGYR